MVVVPQSIKVVPKRIAMRNDLNRSDKATTAVDTRLLQPTSTLGLVVMDVELSAVDMLPV
jgi:hypothetical protein